MDKIRIWLAGNQTFTELAANALRHSCLAIEWVGTGALGINTLAQIQAAQPDIVLLDIDAHSRRILTTLKRLTTVLPSIRLIALTATGDKRCAMRLLRYGVQGYLLHDEARDTLSAAIQAVMRGDVYLCPTASGALVTEYRRRACARKPHLSGCNQALPSLQPTHHPKKER